MGEGMTVNIQMTLPYRKCAETKAIVCCQKFADALENGTDNEGYGSLITYLQGVWHVSDELPPIKYCPWCSIETASNHVQPSSIEGKEYL